MEGNQWTWHPDLQDYYMFRRREVAGKSTYDLIWARTTISEEHLPRSPNTSIPSSVVDPNESDNMESSRPSQLNSFVPFQSLPGPNMPSISEIQGQFTEIIHLDPSTRADSNTSPLYGLVRLPYTPITAGGGSVTSIAGSSPGPRTVTPATSADTPRLPYTELVGSQTDFRNATSPARAASPSNTQAHPSIETLILPSDGGYEPIRNPKSYFKKGRVFRVNWAEPRGEIGLNEDTSAPGETLGATALHVKARMFVVIRPKAHHSICMPIYTYSQQGTSKTGVRPEDHAPLVREHTEVVFHPDEQSSKLKKPIFLILEDTTLKWSPLSRINLTETQSVHYNLKVRTVGRVSPDSLADLDALFREAMVLGEE
ncbi:hypothetical protein BU23DRAFT_166032 [Bimuria novae-zelandiae CBS 107.79]|uniref:DUF6590 domain-containing protein n=1 Tax=Bimuria novae-zelandiae CBS 107.79 TaxID=1447943 RepID=A0A6A5V4D3_9PLEO|nr:hypothetical protein BU23DRAFT_166032 [Bimuria novae-zelandiae CBS 107.79]